MSYTMPITVGFLFKHRRASGHPGTDGLVNGLALQPDGNAIVVGDFYSYDQIPEMHRPCHRFRLFDATFDPGDGVDRRLASLSIALP